MPKEYPDPRMHDYFASLPPEVQQQIREADLEICTLGELMLYAGHLRGELPD